MGDIVDFVDLNAWNSQVRDPKDGGGEPPDMEQRLRHLEQDVAIIKATMATKEDLLGVKSSLKEDISGVAVKTESFRSEMHSLLRQNIMWSVGTIIAVAGLVFAIVRYLG